MMQLLLRTSLSLALTVAVVGCSDDEEGGGGAAASTGGMGDTGTGGSAGTAGNGTGGGGGSGGAMGPVMCGTAMCTVDPLIGMFGAGACCADEAMSTCGVSMAGGACMPPRPAGTPDPRCTPPAGGSPIPLMGCCIEEMCGLDLSILQQGCLEYSELDTLTSMFGAGGLFTAPEPRRCDAPPPAADAGMEDGGTADSGTSDSGASDAGL